jgi:hypothetical protein
MAMRIRAKLRVRAAEQYLDELNEVLPEAEIKFDKMVQQGKLPKALSASFDVE